MHFSDIRMIVMDMDDTLLNDQHQISGNNQAAIAEARAAGITVVLASGRPTPAMTPFANALGLKEDGYVISYNGAYVTDWRTNEILQETSLTKYESDMLVDAAHAHGSCLHTYVNGDIVTDRINPYTDIEADLTGLPIRLVDDLKTVVTGNVPKVLLVAEPIKIRAMQDEFQRTLGQRFTISISKPYFLEFTNQSVDKSAGIQLLCKKLGLSMAQVMAIGDSYNDQTMLEDSGIGVAMDNAPEDIKAIADVTTLSHTQDGVAHIIRQVLQQQRTDA